MYKMLVFSGTSDGNALMEWLAARGVLVTASVATEYGREMLPKGTQALLGRMGQAQMYACIQNGGYDAVIDATHPFAQEATQNIRQVCGGLETPYYRLLRPRQDEQGDLYVPDVRQAVSSLCSEEGNIFLTTGSKDLDEFTAVSDFARRIYVRVLPAVSSIERCLALGYVQKNLIAMHGPFTVEMNLACIRQYEIRTLVTKDSGAAGGVEEKLAAARAAGIKSIVIGRPGEEAGDDFETLTGKLCAAYRL